METTIRSILLTITLLSLGLVPITQAVSPPPDGDYPGGNTAEGFNALFNLSSQDGGFNTAVGFDSLSANVTGSFNTGVGAGALGLNTADNNTAVGAAALLLNTTAIGNTAVGTAALALSNADGNTAVGAAALSSNVTGQGNTAVGARALFSNTGDNPTPAPSSTPPPPNGRFNTAVGLDALYSNTTGNANTAVGAGLKQPIGGGLGFAPLTNNTTGNGNTAVGGTDGGEPAALGSNTTGRGNTAVGGATLVPPEHNAGALGLNTVGNFNTAIGQGALSQNTTGSENTAVGKNAGLSFTTGNGNIAVGKDASGSTAGNGNIAIGNDAGSNLTEGNDNIDIGNQGVISDPPEANTIRIGATFSPAPSPSPSTGQNRTFIAGIRGTAVVGDPVVVDANGQLGTATSSARFKKDIKPMDKTSEAILSLKPVSFQYKSDNKGTPQFGLIAEEVAKVNPDLVVRDRNGEIYSVRYEAVNAMLLNEFLKEHRTVQELKSVVAKQEATNAKQQKQIDALTAGLQRVSAQVETSKPVPQLAENNK